MNEIKSEAGISPVLSTDGLCVGGRVKLLKSICDDGEDHHPPSWIAQAGEVLIVKEILGCGVAVAHEGNDAEFIVYHGEYETHNARSEARPACGTSRSTEELCLTNATEKK